MLRSKYKRIKHTDCTDSIHSPDFQASERQLGKKQCKEGLLEAETEEDTDELYFNVEMLLSERCHIAERIADLQGIEYKCTCPKIDGMDEEELQELYDKLRVKITPT